VAAATAVAGSDRRIVTAGQLAQCLHVELPLAVLLIDSVAALTPSWLQVRSLARPLVHVTASFAAHQHTRAFLMDTATRVGALVTTELEKGGWRSAACPAPP
jgi:hypothetical protein